ncbi:type II secretion system protein N [Kordiimonas aestuarii]|uniref:type II secretion system protein N n=1 Tax=Kordiimonas aestuarii TaxID=1005925 RepID=UPI0021D15578|nr:type II secretion system protein N [Kordiimonas aestuarii]
MLSRAHLLGLFVVAFLVIFIATMPARLAVRWMELGSAVTYSGVEGSLFNPRLSGVSYRKMPIGDVGVEPALSAFVLGSFHGKVTMRGNVSGQFEVVEYSDTEIIIKDAHLAVPVDFTTKGWPLSGAVSLNSSSIALDSRAGCSEGSFTLRTDMFAPALKAFGGDDIILAGDGRCEGGQLEATLVGENRRLAVTVNTAWRKGENLVADITLAPKGAAPPSEAVQMMLDFAGLRREGKAWYGQLSLPVDL